MILKEPELVRIRTTYTMFPEGGGIMRVMFGDKELYSVPIQRKPYIELAHFDLPWEKATCPVFSAAKVSKEESGHAIILYQNPKVERVEE
jgi:hypothetical protein